MVPTMKRVADLTCDWEMTDKDGYAYPHGIRATHRVQGAIEPYNGVFCRRHAILAVEVGVDEEAARQAADDDATGEG